MIDDHQLVKIFSGHVECVGQMFSIGKRIRVGVYSHLASGKTKKGVLRIGNDVMIGQQCSIMAVDHNYKNKKQLIAEQGLKEAKTTIGDGAWIGAGSVVLCGVKIGKGAVVGAGSVVTKNIPAFEVWAGNPAKKIGERK